MPLPFIHGVEAGTFHDHEAAVQTIAHRVRVFYDAKKPYRIYHGATNSTRQSQYRQDNTVDTSRLNHVLHIDRRTRTALVESNVPMDELVQATLIHGLFPPVVMEFPGITCGGGFSGTSAESSSFKHGVFDRTVQWIEMVLPNGQIVSASKDDKPDLFYGAASSFGTLGVTTLLQFRLVEAKKYVELLYVPIGSMEQALQEMEISTGESDVDYLDGIMYGKNMGVICKGRLTNEVGSKSRIQGFTRATDPWFYMHVEDTLRQTPHTTTENIPVVDYLFRYDRGGFWVGKYAFQWFWTPFNRVSRWALNHFMHTRVMFHALHKSGYASKYTIQDVAVPFSSSVEFLDYLDEDFGHYPIWLCPLLSDGPPPLFHRGLLGDGDDLDHPGRRQDSGRTKMMLNFGVWGPGSLNRRKFVAFNRDLEKRVHSMGGLKCLYAHAYYTYEEFWEIYDKERYDALRSKYYATHLPSVYDKVKVDVDAEEREASATWVKRIQSWFWDIWPLAGVYGVAHALLRTDYLLAKDRLWTRKKQKQQ